MKIKTIILAAILSIFATTSANAGGYMGVAYTTLDTNVTDHTGYVLTGGYQYNSVFGIEGRVLVDSSNESTNGINIKIDNMYGAYATLTLPITENLSPYVIGGWTEVKVTASGYGQSHSSTEGSPSYGYGIKYSHLESYTFSLEYMKPVDDADMLSAKFQINF